MSELDRIAYLSLCGGYQSSAFFVVEWIHPDAFWPENGGTCLAFSEELPSHRVRVNEAGFDRLIQRAAQN